MNFLLPFAALALSTMVSCSSTPPHVPNVDVETGYKLGSGDVVHIAIWKDESLTRDTVIRPDGKISFPLIGDILAEGRTVEELRGDLVKGLKRYIPNPSVSVETLQINSYKIFVIGKVNRPGEFQVTQYTDVMQALTLAGGLTPFASESNIRILRRQQGGQTVFPFSYRATLNGDDLKNNIILQRGDVVMVP